MSSETWEFVQTLTALGFAVPLVAFFVLAVSLLIRWLFSQI